jgi:hypothetical protein
MNVLIDLNIVLDVILQRQPWLAEAAVIWDAHVQGRIRGHLVAISPVPVLAPADLVARLAQGTP